MQIKAYLAKEKERIDRTLEGIISSLDDNGLVEAGAYSLRAGGKRLRPILATSSYRACSSSGADRVEDAVYRAACALELIHTYTLIHDDLPVMDDDDFRRGLPTCHRRFGVRRAMHAGLGLLLAAFEQLGSAAECLGLPLDEKNAILSSVARAAGGGGVIGGQVVDLESERKEVSEKTLQYIHSHKTGALISVSCTLGGRLARADEARLKALEFYGEKIGLAFQIVDDLLDVEGDFAQLGKGVGADQARGKATFPTHFGVEGSRRLAQEVVAGAAEELERASLGHGESMLGAIADFIIARKS